MVEAIMLFMEKYFVYSFSHSPFLEQSSAVVSEVEDYSDNEATQEAVEVSEEYISRLIIIYIHTIIIFFVSLFLSEYMKITGYMKIT